MTPLQSPLCNIDNQLREPRWEIIISLVLLYRATCTDHKTLKNESHIQLLKWLAPTIFSGLQLTLTYLARTSYLFLYWLNERGVSHLEEVAGAPSWQCFSHSGPGQYPWITGPFFLLPIAPQSFLSTFMSLWVQELCFFSISPFLLQKLAAK